tara:strand:+ start:2463 stop:3119 length:657 start_codon:yes stop_codon:yes gene_type:complete
MRIIIPYREFSGRCKLKNIREFHEGESLLEISINQLKGHQVSLACIPTISSIERAAALSVDRIDLPDDLIDSSSELVLALARQVQESEPVGFLFCTNPVFYKFNKLEEFLSSAEKSIKDGAGSAMIVYPFKHYVLDDKMQGVNHGQGPWHQYSQYLPQWYINPWILFVVSVSNVLKYNYWYTPDVMPLDAAGPCIDIDTEDDFQLARSFYANFKNASN